MTCYVFDGDISCEDCAVEATDDDIAIKGETDSPCNCSYCHKPLLDYFGLTSEGIEYVLAQVRTHLKRGTKDDGWRWDHGYYKDMGREACVRDWCEHILNCNLDKRDKRMVELYLYFTRNSA